MSRPKHTAPINSMGKRYADGDVWHCTTCGGSGPDRDDYPVPNCGTDPRQPHYGIRFTTAGHTWRTEFNGETWVKVAV